LVEKAWTAKYWNTTEVLDYKLDEIRSYLHLNWNWFDRALTQTSNENVFEKSLFLVFNNIINEKSRHLNKNGNQFSYEFKTM
jgi:hypothetical protein